MASIHEEITSLPDKGHLLSFSSLSLIVGMKIRTIIQKIPIQYRYTFLYCVTYYKKS